MRAYVVAATCVALVNACGGPIGPAQVALPLDSLEIAGIPQSGTVGDRFPLKVTATYLHGETADVTSKVTWTSTSEATAAVQGGELRLVGAGDVEIRASLEQVSASSRVSVAQRPPDTSTLSGLITDSATGRALASVTVQIASGANSGRTASTDESGFYSLPSLLHGTFTLRVTRAGYEVTERTATLSGDSRIDIAVRPLPPPPFTGATFDIKVTVASNRCGIDLPSTGRLVLSGTTRRLTIRFIQGRDEREYQGSLESDGTFSGSSSLFAAIPGSQPHGVSTVKGLVLDSTVSGVEKIASHLCPSGLGIVGVGFESLK